MRDKITQIILTVPKSEAIFEVVPSGYAADVVTFENIGTKVSSSDFDTEDILVYEVKRQWSEFFNPATLSYEPQTALIIDSVEHALRGTLLEKIGYILDKKDVRATNLYKFYGKYAFRGVLSKFDEGCFSLLKLIKDKERETDEKTILGVLELLKMKYEEKLCAK